MYALTNGGDVFNRKIIWIKVRDKEYCLKA